MDGLKFLAFDTGGTVLDWHTGLTAALSEAGSRLGITHDWHDLANEYRGHALRRMTGTLNPAFNIDDVHREVLDELLRERALDAIPAVDRETVWHRWHRLDCWPDFREGSARMKTRYVCVSLRS